MIFHTSNSTISHSLLTVFVHFFQQLFILYVNFLNHNSFWALRTHPCKKDSSIAFRARYKLIVLELGLIIQWSDFLSSRPQRSQSHNERKINDFIDKQHHRKEYLNWMFFCVQKIALIKRKFTVFARNLRGIYHWKSDISFFVKLKRMKCCRVIRVIFHKYFSHFAWYSEFH